MTEATRSALVDVARMLHEAGWDRGPSSVERANGSSEKSGVGGLAVSDSAKQKLVELAARRSTPDRKVSPEQVAAQLLEEAVATAT